MIHTYGILKIRSLGENGYVCTYGWVPLLFTWNYQNIVIWLYQHKKDLGKKMKSCGRASAVNPSLSSPPCSAPWSKSCVLTVSAFFFINPVMAQCIYKICLYCYLLISIWNTTDFVQWENLPHRWPVGT